MIDSCTVSETAEPIYLATLIHGRSLEMQGKIFRRGVAVSVTQAERERLELGAVARVLRDGYDPYQNDPEFAIEAVCALTFQELRAPDDCNNRPA